MLTATHENRCGRLKCHVGGGGVENTEGGGTRGYIWKEGGHSIFLSAIGH